MSMRSLTSQEIAAMKRRDCRASDWSAVMVAEGFSPGPAIHDVFFSGRVELGVFTKMFTPDAEDGMPFPAGVSHSRLHNVRVGDDCLISHARISDTDIENEVVLHQVTSIARDPKGSSFGNGSQAHVLAEDGVRSVPLWRHLTAQMAHLVCHLKKHPAAAALEEMAAVDAKRLLGERSRLGTGCRIVRAGSLCNVWVGAGAVVEGAGSLRDCYIDSNAQAPARIGEGVSAEECVFLPGCRVLDGTKLRRCLVGEGVTLEHDFYGEHSLFFANSAFGLGEASCVMAGPFAASHHRSTLILTCQCSFNTFGSASNASNHHFKQGPRHGGVLRRGTRCGSGSYLFWPSDIGAFTTVVGRHVDHLDTVDFPFSLVLSKGQTSILVPGVNLFTSGMARDSQKWRERDRRGGLARPRDLVNPAILSPYVMQAIEKGVLLLRRSEGMEVDLRHGRAVIPANRVKPALRLYETALVFYVGMCLLDRVLMEKDGGTPDAEDFVRVLRTALDGKYGVSGGAWRDWGGMLLAGVDAEAFIADLANGEFSGPEAVRGELERIHAGYRENELDWAARRWWREHGDPTRDGVAAFIEKWRKAVAFRQELLVRDVGKEFTQEMMYGFGVEIRASEAFRRVRGEASDEPLVLKGLEERNRLLELTSRI